MSGNLNVQSELVHAGQNIGTRVAKKIGKRLSNYSSSKEAASKEAPASNETPAQGGIGQQAMDKGQTAEDETSKGNLDNAKNIAGRGPTAEDETSKGNLDNAKNIAGKGPTAEDETSKGNFDNAKNIAGKGQAVGDETSTGNLDNARNIAGEKRTFDDGTSKGNLDNARNIAGQKQTFDDGTSKGNFDNAKNIASKGQAVEDETSTGNLDSAKNIAGKGQNVSSATGQKDFAGVAGGAGLNKDNINKESIEKVGNQLFGRRESTTFNDDIRKGPIGEGFAGQRDTDQHITGRRGSGSSKRELGQSIANKESATGIASGTAVGLNSGAIGGTAPQENTTGETIGDELNEHSHINSDVFSEGAAGAAGLRGSNQEKAGKTINKEKIQRKAPRQSQKNGLSQRATGTGQTNTDMSNLRGVGIGGFGDGGIRKDVSQGDLGRGALTRDKKTTAMEANDANTSRNYSSLSTSNHKVTVLQEKVQAVSQKCKTQMGVSASDISQRSPTVDAFFDAVATERLRWMPRNGSRLDCCLRWASRLAYAVDALRESIGAFAPGANEAAKLIWGFSILLLESDLDNTDVFESVFGRYGRVAVSIHLLLQYESAFKSSPELQPEAAAVYADLLEMVGSTTSSCVEGSKGKESDQTIGHNVDAAFLTYARRYSTHWNFIVESATSDVVQESSVIYSSPLLGSLRQFLGVQDRTLQFILDSRTHSLVEGSFEWFNNTLYDFTVGRAPVMLVTGSAGSGKSALAQWTVERMQASAEHDDWNLIPYTIRADIPVATLPLRILKGILNQMLDHCVSDKRTQEAILVHVAKAAQDALDGASDLEVEENLWKGISIGLASNIQYMFVVDGLDQIKGGDASAVACLDRICEIFSKQNAGSKMIVFTRPMATKLSSANLQQFTIQASQSQTDLKAYAEKTLSSQFSFDATKDDQLDLASNTIVARSQGSFSWAEMAVKYACQQRSLGQVVSAVQSLPQTMSELLDFHSKNMDLTQPETQLTMSWLAAAERPLLVEEIEQLQAVDPKGPSFISRVSRNNNRWMASLKPLVMIRDGVVSFAHTCIRDHYIKHAKAAKANSALSLGQAHYDLLTRCLAWVQLSIREESEISMDKLDMEGRDHLFDKYVILEYIARYWLSHLLSSPLVTNEGEFQFSTGFKKLVPATVLFARLELTCQESQFTRSSVVELYRLATDVRRLALGEKSMAFLQSLLLSARVSKLAHARHADEHCYEAWRLSQELLGQSNAITLACAEMMTQSFTERGTMTAQQEDIMKYLILTDTEVTGVEFNQRLKYLGMIVGLYKYRSDSNSALLVSKQFYQQILQKYGTNSRQSSETAEFLTGHFSATGNDQMSRDIARTKYDNIVRTMEVTDDRRIKYTLYMAELYEQQGQKAQAQAVLSSLWAGLNSRDIDSVGMMDKKAKVALVYYQFLRRQGHSDEAEVVIRELVADLEVTGVHSPEMMQHVQSLRAETRQMQMYTLDRSLALLMWSYYKENNQEYSTEATTLAMSLAESMANMVSIEGSVSPSGQDRKLMVELLDSIASSPSNLSVSTLVLCHNLASIYVREEDWIEAGDCSKAVLQHIWPSVEQTGSQKKFTTELAPPVADLALILAYCHFRRLHLEEATIIYENAFGSLITSDRVPVASVLAVAKAVVEFYETTFQFTKALNLLHTVSNFLATRLGEAHKHTIDNLYTEAALASRLEMNQQAKGTYYRIYKSTLHKNKLAPEGLEAGLALVGLYEKDSQWDSALDVYRHIWPTLVVQDTMHTFDHIQIERLLEKTYLGYMSILTTRSKSSDFSERYKVASDYMITSRNVYGGTHQKTLSATLLFAELCESNDKFTEQAIGLYKMPLQTSEWVPTAQSSKNLDQMTEPLPITLKHKLAQLFVRKRSSTSEARSLYTEEFQLAKKNQGLFSTTTLSWLRELALAHSRQGTQTSIQQGNALLQSYITDVLHAGAEQDMIGDWARKIAAIYLECGFIEGGNNTLDDLRQRVVNGPEISAMALGDRRDAIFVAAFEEVFGRRASYDQIMDEMAREMQIQQAFSKNLSGHDFVPTLISGDRLARLQTDQKRTRAAKDTHTRLYEYFCATLSATLIADRDIVKQFYQICLRGAYNDNYSSTILTTSTNLVRDLCNASRFQEASDLTGVLHSFLHLTGGLNHYENIITANKLCLYLSGHDAVKCQNKDMFNEMSVKSKLLLQDILSSAKSIGIEIIELPFTDLNDIITLLGEYEMFDDLEAILTQLWTSRIVQRTWTPDVVVWIGRRLVETRFCQGTVDSSIQLCRDICYNLRQVWGSCDNVTLEMTKLLSGLFTASGDYQSAVALHEGVLYDLLNDSDAKGHPNGANAASQHMELLRRAQTRLGKTKDSSGLTSAHADLIAQVTDRFGLQSEQIEGVGDANGGDQFGVWSRPRRFSIDVEDLDDDQGQMHHNHLRESSGAGLLNGSGAPRRISVQAL